MKKTGVIYGFLTWIVTITLILMSHNSNPYIFNIILDIIITVLSLILGINYLKSFKEDFLKEALVFGILIFIINVVLDQFYYNAVGLPMNFIEYMLNVGLIYLVYPIIIGFMGFVFDNIDTIIK
ncbi:MAG: hypothetical protein ACOX01_01800 [Methanobrevibacter boviskoreani]|jgi:lysylphosphatidylglycerol synthetase-like protein (DUF2156 family)|uniref:hypothetical protein n=1 Tax=Methanobrevibacter TaxID=2172 RepID=UPI0003348503|nr:MULTISPECIES: hypothetical protein [Methanobrevibacter]AGN16722.1 hypothetical protein Abm4_0831 [Methanobrevibacter sp. AbM4]MCI6929846.1 hypothetical protein [Methanobrevibacter boviskoreani]MDD6256614.1 hypothetical protein [Methanobrevibacter boviskoreani]MDY5614252.1 hypothetical protein [Methanobrevibacter boviskoreani]